MQFTHMDPEARVTVVCAPIHRSAVHKYDFIGLRIQLPQMFAQVANAFCFVQDWHYDADAGLPVKHALLPFTQPLLVAASVQEYPDTRACSLHSFIFAMTPRWPPLRLCVQPHSC